jgi:choline dehydrogenase-like flavoprotein
LPGDAVGDDELADVIASNIASYGHPAATAPMGGSQDPWAVVDSHGAVNGIDGLRVIDASIMPVVPSVALNPTTIMIAERMQRRSTHVDSASLRPLVDAAPRGSHRDQAMSPHLARCDGAAHESGDDGSPDSSGD